ncbi:YjgP/YjgQ family permease [bacterium]|nr:YjgP/YjgQ family permease [bacterium]
MRIKGRFPRLIDWYILTEVAAPFLGGMAFFTFIFLMFQLLRLSEFFIVHGVPLQQLLQISGLLCLSFIPFALPISYLISLLLGFGRLSSDSELISLKASGISLARMTIIPVFLALLTTGASLFLNLEWVPNAEKLLKQRLVMVGNTRLVSSINEGTFNQGFFDLLIYADKVDSKSNRMEGVFIYDEREPKSPLTVVAKYGQWTTRAEKDGGSTGILLLRQGNIHRSETAEGSYQKIDFDEYRLFLKTGSGEKGGWGKPKMMNWDELRKARLASKANPQAFRVFDGELWRRIAVALAPLAFVLLGVGAGVQPTRSVKSGSSLVAFGVLLLYYGLLGAGSQLYDSGTLPASLALQLGNFVILAWGVWIFRKARR